MPYCKRSGADAHRAVPGQFATRKFDGGPTASSVHVARRVCERSDAVGRGSPPPTRGDELVPKPGNRCDRVGRCKWNGLDDQPYGNILHCCVTMTLRCVVIFPWRIPAFRH